MTVDNVIETIIVLAVIGAVIWYVMPEMRATNIFNGEQRYASAKRKPYPTTLFVILSVLSGLVGICLYKFDFIMTLVLFKSGFRFLAASFVTILITRSDFTSFRNFKYVLMVWLTVIIAAPFFIILFFNDNADSDEFLLGQYAQLMYHGNGFGILALGVLTFTSDYICKKSWSLNKMRFFILLTTEIAVALTFSILIMLIHYSNFWMVTWLIYSILIAPFIWFYKMDLGDYEDDEPTVSTPQEKEFN